MCDEQIVRAFAPPAAPIDEAAGPDPAEEAYERGRREGREQARAEFEARRDELRTELAGVVKQTAELEQRILAECESKMIELSLEVASRIVRERIDAGDPVAQRAVRQAIDAAPAGQPLTVRVNPGDAEAIREALASGIADGRVTVSDDERVTAGGCFVDSPAGTVDATIETATASVAEEARG